MWVCYLCIGIALKKCSYVFFHESGLLWFGEATFHYVLWYICHCARSVFCRWIFHMILCDFSAWCTSFPFAQLRGVLARNDEAKRYDIVELYLRREFQRKTGCCFSFDYPPVNTVDQEDFGLINCACNFDLFSSVIVCFLKGCNGLTGWAQQ